MITFFQSFEADMQECPYGLRLDGSIDTGISKMYLNLFSRAFSPSIYSKKML